MVAALLWLAGMIGAASLCRAADEVTEAAAEELFRTAFEPGVPAQERVDVLKQVMGEFVETVWSDDALWALSEIAEQARKPRTALKYRLKLMEKYPKASLEPYTRHLELYEKSRIPQVLRVIELQGRHIIHFQKRLIRYNPLPMIMHEDIAITFVQWKQTAAAKKHIEEALKVSPGDGVYVDILKHRLAEVKEETQFKKEVQKYKNKFKEAQKNAGKAPAKTEPSKAPAGKAEKASAPREETDSDK